ncbi:Ger(x)C family spore germination protein [Paenibacillus thalictri]|uniref:Ger(X)C family spore germination protein n=1 Tax=Paenibacillus thalictri TaxID=2527873 RepID=A0A4Q9DT55_9BACL|nr:Ger(x)C family spore germination protein [Paenibacillus thalictri]TBL78689.1 Ger(x)C family spore germination protein [Paenibacillus thalictri]
MTWRKTFCSAAICTLILSVLPGCWDRTEINDLAFVLSSSVDKGKDGTVQLAYLIPLPGQMGGSKGGGGGTSGEKSYYVDSDEGQTFREATLRMQNRMARRTFISHRRTMIIGEEFAKDGVGNLFDSVMRNPENRLTSYMVVCKGLGVECMKATPRMELFPSEAIRELSKAKGTIKLNMKSFGQTLISSSGDPALVYMGVKESKKSEKTSKEIEVLGYAIFRDDKMITTMEGDAANGLIWLLEPKTGYIDTIEIEKGKQMTIQLYGGVTDITPSIKNGKQHYIIKSETRARLLENKSDLDISNVETTAKIEGAVAQSIKRALQKTVQVSKETGADPGQLSSRFRNKYPEAYNEQFKPDWRQALKEATFEYEAAAHLTDIGMVYDNMVKLGEKNQ